MAMVPTLGGWIKDPTTMGAQLMDNFIATQKSQTYLFQGAVSSMPQLIKEYNSNPSLLEDRLQNVLNEYFRRYFNDVDVLVTIDVDNLDNGRYNIDIDVVYRHKGTSYSLGRSIEAVGSRIVNYEQKG